MLSIVAMVAVVAVIVLTMKQGVVINDGSSGDLSGQAIIRTANQNMFRSAQKQSSQPQAVAMSAQQMRLQVLIQSCMNKNSLPTYALCRQWALEQLGMDSEGADEARQRQTGRGEYDCPDRGDGCRCRDYVSLNQYGQVDSNAGITTYSNC